MPAASDADLDRYLAALFGGAPPGTFIELRHRAGTYMRRAFYDADDLAAASRAVAELAPQTDLYIGALPRVRHGGTRNDVVAHATVVWADCDTPEATGALTGFQPAPSIRVATSVSNCHAYWLLRDGISLDLLETANRRIAVALGADPQCTDAARVLRAVRSRNFKYRPPATVRLVHCDLSARYDFGHITARLPDAGMTRRADRHVARYHDDALLHLSPRFCVEKLTGVAIPRSGKISCFFHDDRTPSLHVFDEPERGWFCFGCWRGGSIVDFAGYWFSTGTKGEDFLILRERLIAALGLAETSR